MIRTATMAKKVSKLKIPSNPIFPLWLSPEEKARFQAAAARDGYKSMGTWLKQLARDRCDVLDGK